MNAKQILQAAMAESNKRNPHHVAIIERPVLGAINVGERFTFPAGTSDAGMIFTVVEDRGNRKLVRCETTGMAVPSLHVFAVTDEVVRL